MCVYLRNYSYLCKVYIYTLHMYYTPHYTRVLIRQNNTKTEAIQAQHFDN